MGIQNEYCQTCDRSQLRGGRHKESFAGADRLLGRMVRTVQGAGADARNRQEWCMRVGWHDQATSA